MSDQNKQQASPFGADQLAYPGQVRPYSPALYPASLLGPTNELSQKHQNGMGIAGLVLGIVGLVLVWVPFLNLLLGILATVFGGVGLWKAQRTMTAKGSSIAGLTLGVLTVVLALLFFILAIIDYAGQAAV
jgi:hypothetical protein